MSLHRSYPYTLNTLIGSSTPSSHVRNSFGGEQSCTCAATDFQIAIAFSWSDIESFNVDFFHASSDETSATLSETTFTLHTTATFSSAANSGAHITIPL